MATHLLQMVTNTEGGELLVPFPSPTSYDLKYISIDGPASGRNEAGYMVRSIVRENVPTIDVSWSFLTDDELRDILMELRFKGTFILQFKSNGEFGQSFETVYDGDCLRHEFYAGDKNVSIAGMKGDDRNLPQNHEWNNTTTYWNLSISFIGV